MPHFLQQEYVKKIIRLIAGISFLLFCIWLYLTQPVFTSYKPTLIPENITLQVQANQLQTHVKKLSIEFVPRDYSHPENLEKIAQYIESEFKKTKAKVSDQKYQAVNNSYRNVIASFGHPSSETIVIGAHYDSVEGSPGADDNASGIAVLIELGKLLSETPLKTRIELVAYTLEEPPMFRTNKMGSYIHAKAHHTAKTNIRLMISLEMLGYYTDEDNSQDFPLGFLKSIYTDKGNFIAIVGKWGQAYKLRQFKKHFKQYSPIPVFSINAPEIIPGIDFSDHLNYWHFNFPAIMITDTSFYRYPHYHQATDSFEKLDYQRMSNLTFALYRAFVDYANNN